MKRLISVIVLYLFLLNLNLLALNNGDSGIVKTVFENNRVDFFKAEVKAVVKDSALDIDNINLKKDSILIKFEEDKNFPGPVGGISGSPFYIDDTLIGAVAYAMGGEKNHYAVVIPFEKIKNLKNFSQKKYPKIGSINDFDNFLFVSSKSRKIKQKIEKNFGQRPVSIPLFYGEENNKNKELNPGESIIVSLVHGDLSIGALGTVTHVENNKFFAFGHSVFNLGEVNYFVFRAKIAGVVDSPSFPYKIGIPQNLIGVASQDRMYGIYGELEKYPLIIPVNINFDNVLNISNEFKYRIIKNDKVLFKTLDSVIFSSFEEIIPDNTDVNLNLNVEITYEDKNYNLNSLKLKNLNINSEYDLKTEVTSFIYSICSEFYENPFQKIDITKIKIDVNQNDLLKEFYFQNYDIKKISNSELIFTLNGFAEHEGKKKLNFRINIPEEVNKFSVKFYAPDMPEYNLKSSFENYLNKLENLSYDIIFEIYPEDSNNIYRNKIKADYNIQGVISGEHNF
ncbi:MAG: hypothetical protein ACQESP_05640 [Candidatus Muiribacteriota bacterium]